ncbi:cyanoexosortase B system-associated protein [Lyngbya sp. CCY1209]|uniref:cyanoexosortase B system-associated protein n=1 Tax=Lyngbya sp. CCY1209 TaxID=2886103 RepID=UPI002D202854|nr:cyanoexosortase B system-associated protein [Lyngbya sp. CCY1209]MEB3885610.1 cyanoexosortase B system-associated protein [Lyngbya sp. CCY1209]
MNKSAQNLDPTPETDAASPTPKHRFKASHWLLLGFLALLLVVGTLPGYFRGGWLWSDFPPLSVLPELQAIRKDGLSVPGWTVANQRLIPVGGKEWSLQTLERDGEEALLLLFPQNYYKDQPHVEWMDLNGFQRWKTDSYRHLKFGGDDSESAAVSARFFRAWTSRQTYAVLQWYAWPDGGSPAPSRWFFADRKAQLKGDRAPWVAVSVLLPIEPLGNIEEVEPLAESLGEEIQTALRSTTFKIDN